MAWGARSAHGSQGRGHPAGRDRARPPGDARHTCSQRYRCHLEKNATQIAATSSWLLTHPSLPRGVGLAAAQASGVATLEAQLNVRAVVTVGTDSSTRGTQLIPPVLSLFTLLRPYLAHFPPVFSPFFAHFHRLAETVPTSPKPEPRAKRQPARVPRGENSPLRFGRLADVKRRRDQTSRCFSMWQTSWRRTT